MFLGDWRSESEGSASAPLHLHEALVRVRLVVAATNRLESGRANAAAPTEHELEVLQTPRHWYSVHVAPTICFSHLAFVGIELIVRSTNHVSFFSNAWTFDGWIAVFCRLAICQRSFDNKLSACSAFHITFRPVHISIRAANGLLNVRLEIVVFWAVFRTVGLGLFGLC